MATPVMTARGSEFRDVMARLNSGLRVAFNLSPSEPVRGTTSWTGEDGYKVVVVSGSGTAAMEMVMANRFRPGDRVLVPTKRSETAMAAMPEGPAVHFCAPMTTASAPHASG